MCRHTFVLLIYGPGVVDGTTAAANMHSQCLRIEQVNVYFYIVVGGGKGKAEMGKKWKQVNA